jgi:hypothetical protein
MPSHDRRLPMTAAGKMGEFDQLDAYMQRADEDALAALTESLSVEGRLQELLHDSGHSAQDVQEPNQNDS